MVAAIEPKLQLAEIERLKRKPATDLDAYDLLLRAQALDTVISPGSLAAALGCLGRAIAIDPSYAPAMALAAYCYAERRQQGWAKDPEAERPKAFASPRVRSTRARTTATFLDGRLCLRVLGAMLIAPGSWFTVRCNSTRIPAIGLQPPGWGEVFLGNPGKAMDVAAADEPP